MVEAYIEVFKHTRILQARSDQVKANQATGRLTFSGLAWEGDQAGQDEKKYPVDSSGLYHFDNPCISPLNQYLNTKSKIIKYS